MYTIRITHNSDNNGVRAYFWDFYMKMFHNPLTYIPYLYPACVLQWSIHCLENKSFLKWATIIESEIKSNLGALALRMSRSLMVLAQKPLMCENDLFFFYHVSVLRRVFLFLASETEAKQHFKIESRDIWKHLTKSFTTWLGSFLIILWV